ncbi:hypothetical protein TWF225_003820 [Orbilia oligospora]|nr:hypothetical protein TWF225_003820 [Orbilia oligospora]KAF3254292.1 hypothetical protein TWF217_007251 [Orbilia oligospora]KAF3267759.1 hypothetical protein TWF128_009254 [Orbilia oligospora]
MVAGKNISAPRNETTATARPHATKSAYTGDVPSTAIWPLAAAVRVKRLIEGVYFNINSLGSRSHSSHSRKKKHRPKSFQSSSASTHPARTPFPQGDAQGGNQSRDRRSRSNTETPSDNGGSEQQRVPNNIRSRMPNGVGSSSVPNTTQNPPSIQRVTSPSYDIERQLITMHSIYQGEMGYQHRNSRHFSGNSEISVLSRVEDMNLSQVFHDFKDIFTSAQDWCREHSLHSLPSLEWWNNNTTDGVSELSGVLVSNSKTPLEFNQLKTYTIDDLGRAYLCSKIVEGLFPDPESDPSLALSDDPNFEPKDLWAEEHIARYLAGLEAEIRTLNAGRPYTLTNVERWRSLTVSLLNPILEDNGAALDPQSRGGIFAERLFRRYAQLLGIRDTTDHIAARAEFDHMILKAIRVSRQLRQHHFKFIVKYPSDFAPGHRSSSLKTPNKARAVHDDGTLEALEEQVESPTGPIKRNPNEISIVYRPMLRNLGSSGNERVQATPVRAGYLR